jgi:hypothetical protein
MTDLLGWLDSGLDHLWRWISVPAWIICLVCLSPAVWRLVRLRPRYLDPLFTLIALLAVNRLSFLLLTVRDASHGTAFLLALTMAVFAVYYQRHDREVPR